MKLNQILTEDVKAEVRLDAIADQMTNALEQDARRELADEEIFIPAFKKTLGKIKDVVDSKTLGPFYNRLGRITFAYSFFPQDEESSIADAFFDWAEKLIFVHYPVERNKSGNYVPVKIKKKVHSIITHELRHALDQSLSKGKALPNPPMDKRASPLPKKGGSRRRRAEYLRGKEEINARASEAMLDAKRRIYQQLKKKGSIDNETLRKMILTSMRKNDLVHIFRSEQKIPFDNDSFRQLYKRMLKYSEEFIDKAQEHLSQQN